MKRNHNIWLNLCNSFLYPQGFLFGAVQACNISGEERLSSHSPRVLQTDSEVSDHIRIILLTYHIHNIKSIIQSPNNTSVKLYRC